MLQIRVRGLDGAFPQAMSVSSRECVVRNGLTFPLGYGTRGGYHERIKGPCQPRHEGHPDVSALNQLSMRVQADV